MPIDKSSGSGAIAAAGTLDRSLELAAANAVVAQQQAAITRQAAVTSAAAAVIALFSGNADTGTATVPAEVTAPADVDVAAEGGAASAAGDGAFRQAAGLSAALAALDAGNVVAGVATLSSLLSALALARFVATGDERYLAAQKASEAMLDSATRRYEQLCGFAAGVGAAPS